MKGKHWPRLAVVLIALALVAAACGDSDDTTTTAAAAAATTTTAAAAAATTTTEAMAEVPGLVEEGKLIVVTTGNFPPFTLINVDTGANEGYSIDLAAEGYTDQTIYLAWRNNSDDMYVLLVDDIAVSF